MLYNIVISPIAVLHVYPPCQSCQEKPDEFWVRGECNIIGWPQSTGLDHWLYKYKYLGGNILKRFSIDLIWFKYWQLILLMGDWEMGRVDFLSLCNISDIRSQFVLCWSLILFVAGLTELGESGGVGVGWLRVRVHQRTLTPLTPASLLTVIQATGYSNNRCGAGGGRESWEGPSAWWSWYGWSCLWWRERENSWGNHWKEKCCWLWRGWLTASTFPPPTAWENNQAGNSLQAYQTQSGLESYKLYADVGELSFLLWTADCREFWAGGHFSNTKTRSGLCPCLSMCSSQLQLTRSIYGLTDVSRVSYRCQQPQHLNTKAQNYN